MSDGAGAPPAVRAVPIFDLTRQNAELRDELLPAIEEVIASGHFILGKHVEQLEEEVARLCGARYGIGVANCTDALYIALQACGIGPGDEVITTPFTFFATAGSIARLGARPVFVDIDLRTYNLDPGRIEAAITPRTRAIIPVHLYGQPADMDPILEVARRHELRVIEDAAQAIGARYRGRPVGSLGDLACISFFPTKNLGAFGDAGMIVTSDPELAEKARLLRVHGSRRRDYHELLGMNSRLDELQAAILLVKLRHLERWTKRRRELAAQYNELLRPLAEAGQVRLPEELPEVYHVYHQYTIATAGRDKLQAYLKERGIGSMVYYSVPLYRQECFRGFGYRPADYPATERAAQEVLSLPVFPELTGEEQERVAEAIAQYYREEKKGAAFGVGLA